MLGYLRNREVTAALLGLGLGVTLAACGIAAVGTKPNGGDAGLDAGVDIDGSTPANDGAIGDFDGGDASILDAGGTRVPGALALYTFDDGTGKTVSDVSGVAPALDLTIQVNDTTQWTDGGLAVGATSLLFSQAATKIVSACKASNEVTVDAWVKTATITNGTIQRITAISVGVANPVISLSAQNDDYLFRIRTSTQADDAENDVFSMGGMTLGLQHVAMTRSANGAYRAYINGAMVVDRTTGGDLSTWTDLAICVANEHTTDRPWLGELRLVAYYARALSQSEIQRNYAAGPQ